MGVLQQPTGKWLLLWLSVALLAAGANAAESPSSVTLNWLGNAAPTAPDGVSWGVPWPKGKVQKTDSLTLRTADGKAVPTQTWPLAYWPDGSIKWSGLAISALPAMNGPLAVAIGSAASPATPIKATVDSTAVEIDTGAVRCRLPKQGSNLFDSMFVGDRKVAENAKLIVRLEDRSQETNGVLRQVEFVSQIKSVTLEQSGPVRAVVKIEGLHRSDKSGRSWLPFTVRMYFFAGLGSVHIVHSFVFDGDGNKDFIKGLGLSFSVPFKEELHNRHVRFVGDGEGVWAQPVRMLPGYRSQAGRQVVDLYAQHLAGQRVPNLAELAEQSRNALLSVPVWGDAKLTQLGPNGFSVYKRTTADSSWLHVTDGHRSRGLAVLADVSGGIAVGLKDFWQKHPSSIEITGGGKDTGEMKVWLWSPEAEAMDLRHYDTVPHGLSVNYEDWKPGWATPEGIANTADLTLWAFAAIPSNAQLVGMAQAASEPPMLVCTPEYYHERQVFGHWSLPDRSTPTLRWVEDQVQGLVDYYRGQVEERSWYGFWDFGDIMHNYDFGRHEWRYDVGGWAWVNTELMPDMLLWYSFLRTGRADLFRMAENMTRHTSEVDVHHLGPFAPLGSRHNVNHWGDGAKQPRVSHAGLKRFYYFLSGGDERTGDLLREQVDADLAYEYLVQFNGSHYVPTADGGYRLDERARGPAPRPEEFGRRPTAAARKPFTRFGLEWMCYALNWTTEWERGLDPSWRARIEADMRTMAANVDAEGRFSGRYFDMIFGGPENMWEMEPMYQIPEFWKAFANTCEAVGRQVEGGQMTGPRMLAYAAHVKKDAELGRLAWQKLIGNTLPPPARPAPVGGPDVVKPVTDPAFLGAPVGWQLHGVASIQWALNAIETLELAKEYLPQWEAGQQPNRQ